MEVTITAALGAITLNGTQLRKSIEDYTGAVETSETRAMCACKWTVHPDDTAIDDGCCRECNQPLKSGTHHTLEADGDPDHKFKGKRMHRSDEDPLCPVHTKEGLIRYFFEWILL